MFHLGYALISLGGLFCTSWLVIKGHAFPAAVIIGIFALILLVDFSVNHKPGTDSECPMKKKKQKPSTNKPGMVC